VFGKQYIDQKINLSSLSDREFFWLKKRAYLRFYTNPRRIIRIIRDAPSRLALLNRAIGLLRLVLHSRTANQPIRLLRDKLRRLRTNEVLPESDVNVAYRGNRKL